jgi:hypothetical protein
MKTDTLVLLVESDEPTRKQLGDWLEQAGYGVMDCPGPRREDFTCLGIRGRRCALVEIADVAILDGRVLGQAEPDIKAAGRLLHYYVGSQKPVVVLMDAREPHFHFESATVARANRGSRESVLGAIRELVNDRATVD